MIRIVIPSHKRAGRVKAHTWLPGALICVPESQHDDYAKYHVESSLVCHPDSIIGIAQKRQWIYDNLADCMMVDDDCKGFYRIYDHQKFRREKRVSPERTIEIVNQTADLARSMGAHMFGWGHSVNPLHYDEFRFMRFGHGVTQAVGWLRGAKFHWPKITLECEDQYVNLLNAFYHRYMLIDKRFCFQFDLTPDLAGGMLEFRRANALSHHRESYEFMVRNFGSDVLQTVEKSPDPLNDDTYNFYVRLPYRV